MDNDQMTMKVSILRPYRPNAELLEIEQARVLVGSGAHCDIRLDGDGAALEHLVVEPRGGQLFVRALSMNPPVLFRGAVVGEALLPNGSELEVCGSRIAFELPRSTLRGSRRMGSRIAVALLVGLLLAMVPGLVSASLHGDSNASLGNMPAPTVLFDLTPPACKAQGDDASMALARRSYALAVARRERHPFAVEEGVLAVPSFRTAAACFRQAKQFKEADAANDDAAALQAIIERDYFAHRVRLEHAIESDDLTNALVEVRVLRRMTTQRKSAYNEWLAVVERRVESAEREVDQENASSQSAFH